jgi:hypothetical protein
MINGHNLLVMINIKNISSIFIEKIDFELNIIIYINI